MLYNLNLWGQIVNSILNSFNLGATKSIYYANQHSKDLEKSLERLSSGKKVNGPSDGSFATSSIHKLKSDLTSSKALMSHINDNKAMLSTSDSFLNKQLDIIYEIKKNLVDLTKNGLDISERTNIKTNTRNLLLEVDDIASSASYNGFSLLSGGLSNARLPSGIKSYENVKIDIPSTYLKNLGQARFETGAQIIEPSKVKLTFILSDTKSITLDEVIIGSKIGMGIGKVAKLINNAEQNIGSKAYFNVTTTSESPIKKTILKNFQVNGEMIKEVIVLDSDRDNALVDAINKMSDKTGVVASKDDTGRLILNSPDGRGIELSAGGGMVGLNIDVDLMKNYGKLTLVNTNNKRSAIQNPKSIGFNNISSFVFNAKDLTDKKLTTDRQTALGAKLNKSIDLDKATDSFDDKNLVKSFVIIIDDAISNLQNIKTLISKTRDKLTDTQDRLMDTSNIYSNSISDKENVDFAQETFNRNKFSKLISSSTYALTNAMKDERKIIEELLKSLSN